MAHNFRGYDGKFVLAWAQLRSIHFDIIKNGSNIQMLSFLDGIIKFIDTLNFFQCPLKALSETFGISITKGDFSHLIHSKIDTTKIKIQILNIMTQRLSN